MLGLEVARKEHGAVYFKSDSRDHTLCYFEGDPRDHTTAFEVDTSEELEHAGAVLERSGYQVAAGKREDAEQRYVRDFLSFIDPPATASSWCTRRITAAAATSPAAMRA